MRELVEQIETVIPFGSCRDAFLEAKVTLDDYERRTKVFELGVYAITIAIICSILIQNCTCPLITIII